MPILPVTICALVAALLLLIDTGNAFSPYTVRTTTTSTRTVTWGTSTTTVVATKTRATPSLLAPPAASMSATPYSRAVLEGAVLNSTNYFRTHFLAQPLRWDTTLAQFAHKHAEQCIFEHSGGPYGENLAEGFATPALGVDAWAAEEQHYTYPEGGFSEQTGHFTQLVWQNTTLVGCAAAQCGRQQGPNGAFGWYLVCEYSPPGNVIGEFRYNVLKPGESRKGKLGFGSMSAASRSSGLSTLVVALVAASILVPMWL